MQSESPKNIVNSFQIRRSVNDFIYIFVSILFLLIIESMFFPSLLFQISHNPSAHVNAFRASFRNGWVDAVEKYQRGPYYNLGALFSQYLHECCTVNVDNLKARYKRICFVEECSLETWHSTCHRSIPDSRIAFNLKLFMCMLTIEEYDINKVVLKLNMET